MKRWVAIAALALLTGSRAHADDAPAPAAGPVAELPNIAPDKPDREGRGVPGTVRVDVQMVSVTSATAARLVPAFQEPKTAGAAWNQLQAMIERGEARLLGWPILRLQSGVIGRTESILEVRYPTEFTPPQIPGSSFTPLSRLLTSPTWGLAASMPTAFETRDVGSDMEVEAKIKPGGQSVSLMLNTQFSRLLDFRTWHSQASPLGMVGVHHLPNFQTSKITTEFSVPRDKPVLAGVYVFSEPEPHVELFILHARATLLPAATAFPKPK